MPAASSPRLLAFLSAKGGVGKSTGALSIAHALAADHGLSVALVDLDPQASLSDFAGPGPVADPVREAPALVHGVALYRGGRALGAADASAIGAHLARISAGIPGQLPAPDVVVADLSPSPLDAAHRAVLARPETLAVIVAKLDAGGIRAMHESAALAVSHGRAYALAPTFAARQTLARAVLLNLRAHFGDAVLSAPIPADVKAAEAANAQAPVTTYAPRSKAALALREQAAELVARLGLATSALGVPAAP